MKVISDRNEDRFSEMMETGGRRGWRNDHERRENRERTRLVSTCKKNRKTCIVLKEIFWSKINLTGQKGHFLSIGAVLEDLPRSQRIPHLGEALRSKPRSSTLIVFISANGTFHGTEGWRPKSIYCAFILSKTTLSNICMFSQCCQHST